MTWWIVLSFKYSFYSFNLKSLPPPLFVCVGCVCSRSEENSPSTMSQHLLLFHHCIVYSRLLGPGVSSRFSCECLPSHYRRLGSQLWSPHPDFNVGAEVQIQFISLVLQVLLPAEPSIPPQANHFLYIWTPVIHEVYNPNLCGQR